MRPDAPTHTGPPLPPALALHPTSPPGLSREVWTVFRHEFRALLLSTRTLLPMLVYGGFGALSMLGFVKAANSAQAQLDEMGGPEAAGGTLQQAGEEVIGKALEMVGWATSGDVAEIFRDRVPLLELFFFVLASYFLPLLVALVSFDQFSELSTRGARFALLRVRRMGYFVGKALAAAVSVWAFLLAMWLVVVAVTSVRGGVEVLPYAVREGLRFWLLMCVLALPYLAITALISSFVRPRIAFVGTLGAWIGLSLGASIVSRTAPALLVIFPWQHAPKLIVRWMPALLGGVGALLVIAAVVYTAAALYVRRRDV